MHPPTRPAAPKSYLASPSLPPRPSSSSPRLPPRQLHPPLLPPPLFRFPPRPPPSQPLRLSFESRKRGVPSPFTSTLVLFCLSPLSPLPLPARSLAHPLPPMCLHLSSVLPFPPLPCLPSEFPPLSVFLQSLSLYSKFPDKRNQMEDRGGRDRDQRERERGGRRGMEGGRGEREGEEGRRLEGRRGTEDAGRGDREGGGA